MELKNATDSAIDLSGWRIISTDGKIKIDLKGQIPAHGFYLLERTDDNSVSGAVADIIYTGALGNTGQDLTLYDNANNVVDQADFLTKWPAGDNATKQTMEKIGGGWQTSQNPGGTPRAENSQGVGETVAAAPAIQPETPTQGQIAKTYPEGIIINEILPSPEGADEASEWIELYNSSNFAVDVSGWKLQDIKGAPSTYTLPQNTAMQSNGYLVLKRPETHITLNNDEDGLNLMFPDGTVADTVSYANASKNQSYNNTESGWKWSTALTPNSRNITSQKIGLATSKKSDGVAANQHLAAASQSGLLDTKLISDTLNADTSSALNPWWLFLIALAITIISAIIVLLLKIKLFKKTHVGT